MVKIVEHGELHVVMDAMDHGHSPVGQGEDDRVFVRDTLRAKQPPAAGPEKETLPIPAQPVSADPPREPAASRRQGGIGDHQLLGATGDHPLDAGVFETGGVPSPASGQHVLERVAQTVGGDEHNDVGDVVEEPVARARVPAVARTHPGRKGDRRPHGKAPRR